MRLAILLITLSIITGCKSVPNAWICSVIVKQDVESSYAFCVHMQTKEEKDVPIKDMQKWVTTDMDSYQNTRDWYKEQCGK